MKPFYSLLPVALFLALAAPGVAQQISLDPQTITYYGCYDEPVTGVVHGSGGFETTYRSFDRSQTPLNISFGGGSAPTTFFLWHSNPLSSFSEEDIIFSQKGVEVAFLRVFSDVFNGSTDKCRNGAVAGDATISQTNFSLSLASPSTVVTLKNSRSQPIDTYALVTSVSPWLSVTAPNGYTIPANGSIQLVVTANPAGLIPGTYTGMLHFYLDPLNVFDAPVAFNALPPIPITWDASSLTFYGQPFGTLPPSQTITVHGTTSTPFTAVASSTGCGVGGWLNITPTGSLTTDQKIVVTPTQLGFSEGTCTGSIALTAGNQTATIPVNMVLAANPVFYQLSSAPASLQFQSVIGASAPAAQTLQISSAAPSPAVGFMVSSSTAGSARDWLHAAASSATTPYSLSATIDPTGLAAGSYTGSLTIVANTSSLVVPVTLTVTTPALTATPATLSLSYQTGGAAPTATIQVSGGGAALNFFAAATSAGWLSVSPASGTTPASGTSAVTVSVNPAGLAPGQSYAGSVTIAGAGGTAGSTTIPVSLQVVAPTPTIMQIGNASSGAATAIAPGEMIAIFGKGIGADIPAGLTIGSNGKVSTTAGGAQVIFQPGAIAAPIIYASATQVNAIVPYELAAGSNVQVQIQYAGQTSNAVPATIGAAFPGIFTADGSGSGAAAVLNFDAAGNATYNSASNPAAPGSYIAFFVTGEGQTSPAGVTGAVTIAQSKAPITPQPVQPLRGAARGAIPVTAAFWGARSGNLSLSVSLGGTASQSGVTVAVK